MKDHRKFNRLKPIMVAQQKVEETVFADVDIARDKLSRGINQPSFIQMLKMIENLDEIEFPELTGGTSDARDTDARD